MSRAIFLSWVFLITALTFDTALAQTNAREGGRAAEADAPYSKAEALYGEGKLEEAAASLERSIALRPDFAQAHGNLGVVYADMKKYERALECYRRALE